MKTHPSHNLRIICRLSILLCVLLITVSAHATEYGDISVKVESVTEAHSSSGYDEYRVMIINRSPAKSHRVTVEMYGGSYGEVLSAVRRTVEAAPTSVATVSL